MGDILNLKKQIINLGYGVSKIIYTDAATGKIECVKFKGDIEAAFKAGANSVPAEVFIGKEPASKTEFLVITQIETMKKFAGSWKRINEPILKSDEEPKKKKRHKSGNKKMFAKLFTQKMREAAKTLPDKDLGSLIRMSNYIDWDTGVLVDERTKEPLDFEGLLKHTKYSRKTLSARINALKDKDILTKDEEGYKINSEYISKG